MTRSVRAAWGLMVLIQACAHGVEADLSELDPLDTGSGGGGPPVGSGGAQVSGGAAGSSAGLADGSGGAFDASAGTGGNSGATGGASSSGGAGGASGSGGTAGVGGANVDGGAGGADAEAERDSGQPDVVSERASSDAAIEADASCTVETSVAFCARLGKNCGNTTANDRCGNPMTVNCGTCGAFQTCGGGGQANVCGALTAGAGGTVSSSNPGIVPEDMAKAFDANSATKWFAGNGVRTGWIAYQFAAAATHTVTSYSLTSANDQPGRDPSAWQLQGSNDGQTWTTVDTRTGQTFAARFQTNSYSFAGNTAYARYRLNVTANSGGTDLQLADLQFFGQ
jgi:hypothetical protein